MKDDTTKKIKKILIYSLSIPFIWICFLLILSQIVPTSIGIPTSNGNPLKGIILIIGSLVIATFVVIKLADIGKMLN